MALAARALAALLLVSLPWLTLTHETQDPSHVGSGGRAYCRERLQYAMRSVVLAHDTCTEKDVQSMLDTTLLLLKDDRCDLGCPSGYAGPSCQYSRKDTCNDRGLPSNAGECQCDAGYEGVDCLAISKKKKVDLVLALSIGIPVCVVALCLCAFTAYMVRRERSGAPLFSSLDDTEMADQTSRKVVGSTTSYAR